MSLRCLLVSLFVVSPALAAARYVIEDFPVPPGAAFAEIYHVNSAGMGVGAATYRGVFSSQLMTVGVDGRTTTVYAQDIDLFGPISIGNDGRIYGEHRPNSFYSDETRAAYFDDGVLTVLPSFTPGYNSRALAGNSSGVIVGDEAAPFSESGPNDAHGLIWVNGQPSALDPGPAGFGAYPRHINEAGLMAGTSGYVLESGRRTSLAAAWQDGHYQQLKTLPYTDFSQVVWLSETNHMYGLISQFDGESLNRQTLVSWSDPNAEPEILYDFSTAIIGVFPSVAADGTAIGVIFREGESEVFLIKDGVMSDLTDLLVDRGEWGEFWGANITGDGRIYGYGTKGEGGVYGFIATPVPEPGGLVAVVGLVGLGMRRGRDRRAGE